MDDTSSADASDGDVKQPCFVENARDSGTDLNDSIIMIPTLLMMWLHLWSLSTH